MGNVDPPAWHVDPVSRLDDMKIIEIMAAREELTGERQSKAGTIRRAIRRLWREEVLRDGQS